MKLIILDYLKRWRLVWIAIGIFDFFIFLDDSKGMNYISLPILLWLSAFGLNFDLQRGSTRVLTTLPVSTRQIGRAWWILSVAMPTLFIAATSGFAMFIHSAGTANGFPMNDFVMTVATYALYFGSIFYLLIGSSPIQTQNAVAWIRTILVFGFMIEIYFVKLTFDSPRGIILMLAAAIFTVIGWFRAEQMVLHRVGFKLIAPASNKKSEQPKIPQGFGGLHYLAQRSFVLSTIISLALIGWMTFAMSFIHISDGQNRTQAITSAVNGGETPWFFFILIFSIVPMVFQLRVMRTLPIPSSALAATLVFLPILSIAAVGVIVTTLAVSLGGQALMLQTINSFLMIGAKATIMVTVIVWRGLDAGTYLVAFLLVVADSFISLGITMIFHLGSQTPEHPWWIALTVFILCATASFALTRKLLTQSSSAYRVRVMPSSAWSMTRR